VVGWLGLATLLVVALHAVRARRRRPRAPVEVRDFVERLRRELIAHHPEVRVLGLIPGRFAAVISVRGQELPVSLHHLFQQSLTFPNSFSEMVRQFVEDAFDRGLERTWEHGFADVATSILPQIRTRAWLREHGSVFGQGALVHRDFTDDLVICYVIDDPWCMTFVCRAHLQQWGYTEDDLYHLATRNLNALAATEVPLPGPEDDGVLVRTGDGFDAARVLLLDREKLDGLLVGLPERDVLWLGDGEKRGLEGLMALNAKQARRASHPLSPTLYRVTDGELVPVKGSRSESRSQRAPAE